MWIYLCVSVCVREMWVRTQFSFASGTCVIMRSSVRVRPYTIFARTLRKWNKMEQVLQFFFSFRFSLLSHSLVKWQLTANAKWLINSSAWLLIVKFWRAISVSFRISLRWAMEPRRTARGMNSLRSETCLATTTTTTDCCLFRSEPPPSLPPNWPIYIIFDNQVWPVIYQN